MSDRGVFVHYVPSECAYVIADGRGRKVRELSRFDHAPGDQKDQVRAAELAEAYRMGFFAGEDGKR